MSLKKKLKILNRVLEMLSHFEQCTIDRRDVERAVLGKKHMHCLERTPSIPTGK